MSSNGPGPPKKIILRNSLSPGDIVMLTAAVRDLHQCHPGAFLTDVRTTARDLWQHNPHLTPLDENDGDVVSLDCQYPLIHRSNQAPFHFLHGFTQFLSEKLGVSVTPTAFKGDIHLSGEEKGWISQVREITGTDEPFWIVVAGGKRDFTIKWWSHERFQQVVDRFAGRIQFVQVGEADHHHPPLEKVIDLRGKTDIRQLVRLVHHAQGVLCPVTFLMHLAAAVPAKRGQPAGRPCVVVAGGREPSHWEAYPGHRFLHTQGALPCCENGGCWKARTVPLGDGDEKDRRENLCVRVSPNGLPRCMDMITVDSVVAAIESYFEGGLIRYLNRQLSVSGKSGKPGENGAAVAGSKGVRSRAGTSESESRKGTGMDGTALSANVRAFRPQITGRNACATLKNPLEAVPSGTGIKLYSLRRSGTHAVANWIAGHYDGTAFYANDVNNRHPGTGRTFACDRLPAIDGRSLAPADFHSSKSADLSLAVFEDAPLWASWEGEATAIRGKEEILKVLVLRDPFNMIASRLSLVAARPTRFLRERMLSMEGTLPACVPLWKAYAREFLRLREQEAPGVVLVNYNRWATSRAYRQEISRQLGRPFTDREKERVPGEGFGSSFDGTRLDNNASRMDVLNRWKRVEHDQRYRAWTSDRELRYLAEEIFGAAAN